MSKWFISLLAFLIYAGICEYIYLCPITKVICPTDKMEVVEEVEEPPVVEEEIVLAPIMFNWNDPLAVKTDYFTEEFRQSILTGNRPDSVLEITGYYSPSEINNTDYDNLGFARAARIAEFFPDIPSERIELLSRKVGTPNDDPGELFEFSEMTWVYRPEGDAPAERNEIVSLADREIIYFPFNSADRIKNPKLEEYLSTLADQLKSSGGKITLTGHTDNVGEEITNEQLGRSRANDIRRLLIAQGVSANQINVNSMGEREPIASNATDQGRARNRRVVVVRNN